VRFLLDTHALLWWLTNDPLLGSQARETIADAHNEVLVSAASAWEIGIKKALGKLAAPDDLEAQVRHHNFTPLPITIVHAARATSLPPHHSDPFDRMLIGQALSEGLTLVTADERLSMYLAPILSAS